MKCSADPNLVPNIWVPANYAMLSLVEVIRPRGCMGKLRTELTYFTVLPCSSGVSS